MLTKISGLGQFSDLNSLSGSKEFFFKRIWSLADLYFSVFTFIWAKFQLAISVFHPLNFRLAVRNYAKQGCEMTSSEFCFFAATKPKWGTGTCFKTEMIPIKEKRSLSSNLLELWFPYRELSEAEQLRRDVLLEKTPKYHCALANWLQMTEYSVYRFFKILPENVPKI